MGAIRDSFKKFLGFDVEEHDKIFNSQTKEIEQDSPFKKNSYEEEIQDSNDQSFNEMNNVRKRQRDYTVVRKQKLENNQDNSANENNQSILAKSSIKYEKPKTYGDACEIVEFLLEGYTVFVDVIDLEVSKARRIVDFIDGAIFAAGGDRQIIKHKYFKFSPTYEEEEENELLRNGYN
ncbi:cell division protein SepF [Haloplasma contractile]|uniref:Cell division protein SepF n=1 Tax=Haloplasma contractile SSD-17B TaxID=1033810 RepID=U2FLI8_9MOLU|nr:cell division protein SepF [Haloplasma contractile]ERJ13610.1 Cell division protein SepF [Haloplasma contractile SSD-17B]